MLINHPDQGPANQKAGITIMDNTITIVRNLTRDPELRYTPSGQPNASFGVAVNRVWTDRQTNERKEQVSFDVVCWREMAGNACETLAKGARVIVTGRLEQRSWEDNEGNRRSKVEILADDIGPSLRWATAEVAKNEKRSTEPAMAGKGGPAPEGPYDEEPF